MRLIPLCDNCKHSQTMHVPLEGEHLTRQRELKTSTACSVLGCGCECYAGEVVASLAVEGQAS